MVPFCTSLLRVKINFQLQSAPCWYNFLVIVNPMHKLCGFFDAMLLLDATIIIRVRYIVFLFDITLRQRIIELVLPISCFFSTSVEILSQMTLCIENMRWSNPHSF
jgi:hypothetical protein